MSYVDDIKEKIYVSIDGIQDTLKWLKENGPRIIRTAVYAAPPLFPPRPPMVNDWTTDQLIELLQQLIDKLSSALAELREMVKWLGSPDNLRAAAMHFGNIARQSEQLATEQMLAGKLQAGHESNWHNADAHAMYLKEFQLQTDAMPRIKTTMMSLKEGLEKMAEDIEEFYVAVLGAAVGVLSAAAGLATGIAGLATGPFAIATTIIGAIEIIVGGLALATSGLELFRESTKERGAEFDSVGDLKWPAVVFS